ALEAVGLQVNRLIRVSYGPVELGELSPGAVEEVSASELSSHFAELLDARPERTQSSKKPGKPRRPLGKPRRRGKLSS
ncbi:MAG: hypothetical protein AAFY10_13395, partial [Pseudomonadota bacterium]